MNDLDILLDDPYDVMCFIIFNQGEREGYPNWDIEWQFVVRKALKREDVRQELRGFGLWVRRIPQFEKILKDMGIKDLTVRGRIIRGVP